MFDIRNPLQTAEKEIYDALESVDEIRKVLILPDVHVKDQMESLSSAAYDTGNVIIPSLASAAINDGMSVIKLPFKRNEMSDSDLETFFGHINKHASNSKFKKNKYSLTVNEFEEVCRFGARAVMQKFNISDDNLGRMELNGCMGDVSLADYKRLMPFFFKFSRFVRCEFGLNFRGNHFLELQKVHEVVKANNFKGTSVEADDLVVMTHLGPGPLTGNLMRLFTNRKKIPTKYRIPYFFAKALYHYFQNPQKFLQAKRKKDLYFNPEEFKSFDVSTQEGKDLLTIIKMGTNYGFAYQMGTFASIIDATKEFAKSKNIDTDLPQLIWNVSHNSIYEENGEDNKLQFVTRHNATKTYYKCPTILAGSYDMDSMVGFVNSDIKSEFNRTHDHGLGKVLERFKEGKNEKETDQISNRLFFTRGDVKAYKILSSPVLENDLLSQMTSIYQKSEVFDPWFILRPIATLKN